eukprot:TRINITY_DN28558_c0_g1_i2.p1 TRINITY_DN28558_c0_g1~~TRINITY_DN28558_c0_g1_i2.p1  ORF type:complete len:106 (-),score=20.33 TRINITY_DN28558_c0_g1_i2:7-324(-)
MRGMQSVFDAFSGDAASFTSEPPIGKANEMADRIEKIAMPLLIHSPLCKGTLKEVLEACQALRQLETVWAQWTFTQKRSRASARLKAAATTIEAVSAFTKGGSST